jgi:N-acetyl-gamma-glutamyl-phosphate reductase
MKRVFIDGSAGTTGLRIHGRLSARKDVQLLTLSEADRKISEKRAEMLNVADAAFLCLPDAAAVEAVSMLENPDTVLFDTSTAHRTNQGWAYGFPELSDAHMEKIKSSKRIAVPGCHASGFVALVYPLVESGILPKSALLTCTSLTGYSGGGKKMIAEYEAENRDRLLDSPKEYALTQSHKHLPEMKEVTGLETAPIFLPIVADYYSGMQVTVPVFQSQLSGTADDVREIFRRKYRGPIVRYADWADDIGFGNKASGFDGMEIAVAGNDERILLIANFDNLGKGASGAAVECMNLAFGFALAEGLALGEDE